MERLELVQAQQDMAVAQRALELVKPTRRDVRLSGELGGAGLGQGVGAAQGACLLDDRA